MSKALDKIVGELIELGYDEKKIIKTLKNIKVDLVNDFMDSRDLDNEKKYNKYINELIFGDDNKFGLTSFPSKALLGMKKAITKLKGAEYMYFLLVSILNNGYFYSETHNKTDEEKCNLIMYRMKNDGVSIYEEFKRTKINVEEPVSALDMEEFCDE